MSATGKDQQVKANQRAKEEAVHKKKEAIKDKQWAIGAKDTTKSEADSEKTKEKEKRKAEKKAIEANEGGSAVGGGGGAPVVKRCKECKMEYNAASKKGCQNCVDLLFGGGQAPKKGRGKGKK